MKRRNFIRTSAIGSSCVLAGTMISENAIASKYYADYSCKITVLKKTLNQDWNREYRNQEGTDMDM